jgi:hypothetical protein
MNLYVKCKCGAMTQLTEEDFFGSWFDCLDDVINISVLVHCDSCNTVLAEDVEV